MTRQFGKKLLYGALGIGSIFVTLLTNSVVAQTTDEIIARGKVVIAVDTAAPPYGSLDSSNKPVGIDIDVANLIGQALKVPVELVTVPQPGRIPALLSKRVDMVIAIFSITPERALQITFSNPYAGQSAVIIAPKSASIKTQADLKDQRVAMIRGQLDDTAIASMEADGARILRFDDQPSQVQAILSGQADAMIGGDYGEIYLRKSAKGEEFEQKYVIRSFHFGIGIRKGNPELHQWLNTFVYQLKNGGEIDRISRKWRNGAPMIPLPVI